MAGVDNSHWRRNTINRRRERRRVMDRRRMPARHPRESSAWRVRLRHQDFTACRRGDFWLGGDDTVARERRHACANEQMLATARPAACATSGKRMQSHGRPSATQAFVPSRLSCRQSRRQFRSSATFRAAGQKYPDGENNECLKINRPRLTMRRRCGNEEVMVISLRERGIRHENFMSITKAAFQRPCLAFGFRS